MSYETTGHVLWVEPSDNYDTAIKCKNCGYYYDENNFKISEKKAYDNYEVIDGFCSDECKLNY